MRGTTPMIRFEESGRTGSARTHGGVGDGEGTVLLAGHGPSTGGLTLALRELGFRVAPLERFDDALEDALHSRADTVLVGTHEGAGDGLRFIYEIGRALPDATILAFTDGLDALETDLALAAGAHDVIPPPHSARAIVFRRRVVQRTSGGRTPRPDACDLRRRVALGHLVVDLTTRQVLDGTEALTLSGREFELLVRLMEARGEVVTRERLLHDIWGAEQGSEAVLDATVHRLRRRLEEKLSEHEVVATVRGIGYRLDAPGPALSGAPGQG